MTRNYEYHVEETLRLALEARATDIHFKESNVPALRVDGALRPTNWDPLTQEDMETLLNEILNPEEREQLDVEGEVDVSFTVEGVGRFRVNCYRQRGHWAIVLRHVNPRIPSFAELNLPEGPMTRIAGFKNGLVLVTGAASSGKSTTLAAIIDRINHVREGHIVTLEDPIEYLHTDDRCRISQREVGIDTKTFYTGLRAILREDPDVILIGELRDVDTFETCISAAESGHLVLSSLHTTNIARTIDRILDWFPAAEHAHIRSQLALNLRAVVCQRLMPLAASRGRIPALEILFSNPAVANLISEGEIESLPIAIANGAAEGMQTFNMHLVRLVKSGKVLQNVAEAFADNPEELKMNLQGIVLSRAGGRILKPQRDRERP